MVIELLKIESLNFLDYAIAVVAYLWIHLICCGLDDFIVVFRI